MGHGAIHLRPVGRRSGGDGITEHLQDASDPGVAGGEGVDSTEDPPGERVILLT